MNFEILNLQLGYNKRLSACMELQTRSDTIDFYYLLFFVVVDAIIVFSVLNADNHFNAIEQNTTPGQDKRISCKFVNKQANQKCVSNIHLPRTYVKNCAFGKWQGCTIPHSLQSIQINRMEFIHCSFFSLLIFSSPLDRFQIDFDFFSRRIRCIIHTSPGIVVTSQSSILKFQLFYHSLGISITTATFRYKQKKSER